MDIQSKKENKMEAFVTVREMIDALRALPADARLVVTESGYYSYGELARVGLPEAYTMDGDEDDIPRGTVVYRIGHSHQSY
jgi:UDP-N-acetylglucosamine:LPS N-acetylglucosamine transferase